MARPKRSNIAALVSLLLPALLLISAGPRALCRSVPSPSRDAAGGLQTYIVHVRSPEGTVFPSSEDRQEWHRSFLPTTTAMSSDDSRMVYSYGNVISGFSARLTRGELKDMAAKDGFLHANPDRILPLQTTHTPEFLGLHLQDGFVDGSNLGRGVIVGLIDTGVTPDHPSFGDDGMPPPPAKWKGRCDFGASQCNNKLIGARLFSNGTAAGPPVDDIGHGTHTASTAAGQFVKGAEVLGEALGTASGMAPRAHLAIYKVCDMLGCSESDILAAMDAAVEDGVDVLSISIGGESLPFYADDLAIAAFGAIEKGVFVSCAGGNSGPSQATLANEAPWILTVAASSMDRSIRASVKLGNGAVLNGESLYQPKDFPSTPLPLVYAGSSGQPGAAFCGNGSLDGLDVKGKAVLCEDGGDSWRTEKGQFVKDAGAAAMVLMNTALDGYTTHVDNNVLPASNIGYSEGSALKAYIGSSDNATASFSFLGTVVGTAPAPAVASFSSRGPSQSSPGILKPDITGPGLSVLAAWPESINDTLSANAAPSAPYFNIISGTSMATPHLSGIAALLRAAHRDWSPAAIKSAIMTTAETLDRSGRPITDERRLPATYFALGSGHVNPTKAVDPGLVYDLTSDDYVPYLCGLGYTTKQVQAITRMSGSCDTAGRIPQWDLNYPSMSVILGSDSVTVKRTVKNVGAASSVYTAKVINPPGVSVSVEPQTLQFSTIGEEKNYTVTLSPTGSGRGVSEGQLVLSSGKYVVRSPISVTFQ